MVSGSCAPHPVLRPSCSIARRSSSNASTSFSAVPRLPAWRSCRGHCHLRRGSGGPSSDRCRKTRQKRSISASPRSPTRICARRSPSWAERSAEAALSTRCRYLDMVVRSPNMNNTWFALIGVLSIILISPVPAQTAAPHPLLAEAQTVLALSKDDRILGNPDAPITIVEYASLTCPHCAHFTNEVLPELKKKWIGTGKAKLVLRDYPLDEPALRAAMIARCAPPDRYYAYIDTFFGSQEKGVTERDYRDALARLVTLGGMSREECDNCLKNTALETKSVEDRLIASKELDVNSTPTFFINGTKFTGAPTVEEFDKALSGLAPES